MRGGGVSTVQKQMMYHLLQYSEYRQLVGSLDRRKEDILREMGSSTVSWQAVGKKEAGNNSDIVLGKVERIVRLEKEAAEAAYWIGVIESACDALDDRQREIARAALKDQNDSAVGRRFGCCGSTVANIKKRLCAVMAELTGEE